MSNRNDYIPTHWEDEIIDEETGQIIYEGTPLDETRMNNIEDGILISHLDIGILTLFIQQLSNLNQTELEKYKKQRLVQGRGAIANNISDNGYFRSSEPFTTVSLDGFAQINAPDYDVLVTPTSASDMGAIGNLEVFDKTQNGFKVRMTGSAESVTFLWTLVNPNV